MKINKRQDGTRLTIALEGRLDTNTSQDLEKELVSLEGIEELVFDLRELEYMSSAGLRILLGCQKKMNSQGSMIVRNANNDIKEIFDMVGFSDIINII